MLPDLIDQEYAMKMSNIIWEAVIQIKPLSYIYLQATLLFFFLTCKFLRFYYLKQKIVQIWILQSYWDPSENNELLPQTFSLANARFHYFQK